MRGDWPNGKLRADAPIAAAYAATISKRLIDALADHAVSDVAASADLARSTVHDLVSGRSWPDIVSLAKLETTLNVKLWPEAPPSLR